MGVIGAAGASIAIGGAVLSGASGWSSPTGLASFLVALTGTGAFLWSVYQGLRRKREIDLDAAREFVRLMQEAKDDDDE